MPLVPFFVINLAMGLTQMRTGTYYWVSQLGMLAGTVVYVNAGTQLARIESLGGILSPALIGSFVLLGVFPLVARKIVEAVQRRKVYARWSSVRPRRYDRNLVVIGAGAAGLVTSYIAAAVKAKVTLVESHRMGGDCLNYGCVPSKALIRSARLARQMRDASGLRARAGRAAHRLRRGDGARAARRARHRAARFGRALRRARRRCRARPREARQSVDGRDRARRRHACRP